MTEVLAIFVRYGFRKTSMDDVARAIGISRQALYKRYESKEALFRLVVSRVIESSLSGAMDALDNDTVSLSGRLLNAFDSWAGQHVDVLRSSPHSLEVIEMAKAQAGETSKRAEGKIAKRVAELLCETGSPAARAAAADAAFALACASKGLLHTAENRSDYKNGMKRVISGFLVSSDHPAKTKK
ncbi:MAG: TetR/AcrR family transcriptional regulator [Methyloligellaceae bacterium]